MPGSSARPAHIFAQQHGAQEVGQDVPGRAGRLVGVAGIAVGDALAVSHQPLGVDEDQDALALGHAAEGGLERRDQGHSEVVEGDVVRCAWVILVVELMSRVKAALE